MFEQLASQKTSDIFDSIKENKFQLVNSPDTHNWTEVLQILSRKMKARTFDTWIKSIKLVSVDSEFAVLAVKNEFTRNLISQSYIQEIKDAIKEVFATALGIRLIIDPKLEDVAEEIAPATSEASLVPKQQAFTSIDTSVVKAQASPSSISSTLSFANLYQGQFNASAVMFARAVLDAKQQIYKSLFITSGTGLGKTHLAKAIAEEATKLYTPSKVKYVQAETFTNEFVLAIRNNSLQDFKNRYRSLEFMVLDDLQFLANKKASQEEFMHCFDSIINKGGKVIVTSNVSTKVLQDINSNLLSRLEGSLNAEICATTLDERIEIIKSKAGEFDTPVSQAQIEALAKKYSNDIRELEGAILQLSVQNMFATPDDDQQDEMYSRMFGAIFSAGSAQGTSVDEIIEAVAKKFDLKASEIKGKKRQKDIAQARHVAMYLIYDILELSYARIGESFSKRKHSSVIHSIKTVTSQIASKDNYQSSLITEIVNDIKSQFLG